MALVGRHNVLNGLAALAAVQAVGVDPATVMPALAQFQSVKRRLEVIGSARAITVYDDFAHHPTAIATTLQGLRAKVGAARVVVAMEPRSNSMRLGAHAQALAPSLHDADAVVFLHRPELAWDAAPIIAQVRGEARVVQDVDALLRALGVPGPETMWCSCPTVASTVRRVVSWRSCPDGADPRHCRHQRVAAVPLAQRAVAWRGDGLARV